jgi:hypothetical protein
MSTGGMKEGTGSDPFADDSEEDSDAEEESSDVTLPEDGEDSETTSDEVQDTTNDTRPESTNQSESESVDSVRDVEKFPFIYRRNYVDDEREARRVFMQDATISMEETRHEEVNSEFEETVPLLDFREAVYVAGMSDVETEVVDVLEDWGYGLR